MFLLLLLLISFSFYFVFLTWCLRLHARVLRRPFCVDSGNSMCFSYWKNVRLKPLVIRSLVVSCFRFQLLLKECTIEALLVIFSSSSSSNGFSCYWKNVRLKRGDYASRISRVLFQLLLKECTIEAYHSDPHQAARIRFQLLLKECTIEAENRTLIPLFLPSFSCYWKNVRLKLFRHIAGNISTCCFSCYWKNVRLKLKPWRRSRACAWFQLLLKECTIEASLGNSILNSKTGFSCYWKNVRLKLPWPQKGPSVDVFQLLLKECTIEAEVDCRVKSFHVFQLLLKECTIEAPKPTDWK